MVWLTERERVTLTWLGGTLLVGLGLLGWQRHRAPFHLEAAGLPADAAAWTATLDAARRVDINTAGVAALERLPGIGPALAARIVEERATHGPFGSARDLSRVRGIGSRLVDALAPYVTTE